MSNFAFESNGKLKLPTDSELAAEDDLAAILAFSQGFTEDKRPYWAYIAVKPSMYRRFRDLSANGAPLVLADYGTVIESGFASVPPPEVLLKMRNEYNFDTEFRDKLTDEFTRQQDEFLVKKENKRIDDIVTMLKMRKPN